MRKYDIYYTNMFKKSVIKNEMRNERVQLSVKLYTLNACWRIWGPWGQGPSS